jgi:Domain of unknown function (DUF4911)
MERLDEVFLRIRPDKFHYLKFILEGYDNLAILSAYDCRAGLVVVRFPRAMAGDFYALLGAIAGSLGEQDDISKRQHILQND